jgi:hypothetical protein
LCDALSWRILWQDDHQLEHPRNTKLVLIPVLHGTEGHIFCS